MGTLDGPNVEECRVEELVGNNAPDIEGEINNKLQDGWTYRGILAKQNKIYIIFIR